jgi:hypothetical protein
MNAVHNSQRNKFMVYIWMHLSELKVCHMRAYTTGGIKLDLLAEMD